MAFNRNFKQSPDQSGVGFDNMIAQSAMLEATRLFTELRIKAGSESTGEERRAAMQLRFAMVDEISQLARQGKGKIFSDEEYDKMETMPLKRLRSELGYWYEQNGITMTKTAPKLNYFKILESWWIQVRKNREHYIKSGTATNDNYKIIILKESEASPDEKKNVFKTIAVKKVIIDTDKEMVQDMELLDKVQKEAEAEAEGEVIDDEHNEEETPKGF